MIKSLKENFLSGDQSILFLNRRGYAQLMLCQSCGKTLQCDHCNISLTLHQSKDKLACHYCGFSRKTATLCPNCQSETLISVGFGTERVESELKKIIPQARIARLDRDTTLKRHDFIKILREVHHREVDVLIGTQMVAKGHHFPGVTLVGVIWADASLGIPDYKSSERTFQILTQVFGRAGRGDKPGRVIVQTHYPDHYSIKTAQSHEYTVLFDQEIALRKALSYPPFSRLINIRFEGKQMKAVGNCAQAVAKYVKNHTLRQSMEVLGPSPAPLSILRDLHRWQLLIKSSNLTVLSTICEALKLYKTKLSGMSSVKLTIDVDPESML
nr:primosomal protein N' [Desulfobulbaceae bacterium]